MGFLVTHSGHASDQIDGFFWWWWSKIWFLTFSLLQKWLASHWKQRLQLDNEVFLFLFRKCEINAKKIRSWIIWVFVLTMDKRARAGKTAQYQVGYQPMCTIILSDQFFLLNNIVYWINYAILSIKVSNHTSYLLLIIIDHVYILIIHLLIKRLGLY